ncbi:MAG TPA: hypothetical protein VMD29_04325 [Terracidiphilus sp.]|nr:hypothetical protein [Terracidiphilus sp.]
MGQERRMILSLVASGRITAGEAERLLAAASEGREWLWIAVAFAVLGAAQGVSHGLLPVAGHVAQVLGTGWVAALHGVAEFLKGMGGWR